MVPRVAEDVLKGMVGEEGGGFWRGGEGVRFSLSDLLTHHLSWPSLLIINIRSYK